MALSTVYLWILFGCGLGVIYYMMTKLTIDQIKRLTRKGTEIKSEIDGMRMEVTGFFLLCFLVFPMAIILVIGSVQSLYQDLPNRITGDWPIYEGTIVGWHIGYRGSESAMIQIGDETKGYDLRNANIHNGDMVGVTVRMACNGSTAYILEYEEDGSWVELAGIPHSGKEKNVVTKTIVMNLLAGVFTCGFILRKIFCPSPNSFFKNKHLQNAAGLLLIGFSFANELVLCRAVIAFPENGIKETYLMNSQLLMLAIICANVLFCIMASQKTQVYHYWLKTAKEFFLYSSK